MLVYDCHLRKSPEPGNSRFEYKYRHIPDLAHDKGISSMVALPGSHSSLLLATGGVDRRLYLWEFKRNGRDFECKVGKSSVHNIHTSAVQSVFYNRQDDVLFSGGFDCRFVGWSLRQNGPILSEKFEDKVRV
jgi:WD40 repeat protein